MVIVRIMAMMVILTACVQPRAMPTRMSVTQPVSPLISEETQFLAANRWRLIEISYQSMMIEFAAIAPVYITFTTQEGTPTKNQVFVGKPGNNLMVKTVNCNAGGFSILFDQEQNYRLVDGFTTWKHCGDRGNLQYAQLFEKLQATTVFKRNDNYLLLRGHEIQITLEIDNSA